MRRVIVEVIVDEAKWYEIQTEQRDSSGNSYWVTTDDYATFEHAKEVLDSLPKESRRVVYVKG